jgi:hypothetical protein
MPGFAGQLFSTPPCGRLVSFSTEGEEMTCLKKRFMKE